jgi:hypothetical protein
VECKKTDKEIQTNDFGGSSNTIATRLPVMITALSRPSISFPASSQFKIARPTSRCSQLPERS